MVAAPVTGRAGRSHEHAGGISILALLAFLLAVTMGMASDRFDTRRGLVREEANTIGTTYLRAGYLAEPYAKDIQNLLREYAPAQNREPPT